MDCVSTRNQSISYYGKIVYVIIDPLGIAHHEYSSILFGVKYLYVIFNLRIKVDKGSKL